MPHDIRAASAQAITCANGGPATSALYRIGLVWDVGSAHRRPTGTLPQKSGAIAPVDVALRAECGFQRHGGPCIAGVPLTPSEANRASLGNGAQDYLPGRAPRRPSRARVGVCVRSRSGTHLQRHRRTGFHVASHIAPGAGRGRMSPRSPRNRPTRNSPRASCAQVLRFAHETSVREYPHRGSSQRSLCHPLIAPAPQDGASARNFNQRAGHPAWTCNRRIDAWFIVWHSPRHAGGGESPQSGHHAPPSLANRRACAGKAVKPVRFPGGSPRRGAAPLKSTYPPGSAGIGRHPSKGSRSAINFRGPDRTGKLPTRLHLAQHRHAAIAMPAISAITPQANRLRPRFVFEKPRFLLGPKKGPFRVGERVPEIFLARRRGPGPCAARKSRTCLWRR